MKLLNFLKEKNILLPVLGAFLILSLLIFFMAFNFGLEKFRSSRGLASNYEAKGEVGLDKLVIKDLGEILKGRKTEHSKDPTVEEQFLFGFLMGNYKPFAVGKRVVSLKLKGGHKALMFISDAEKKDLASEFKDVYLSDKVSLADPVNNRFVASEQTSYSIVKSNIIVGRIDFKFSKNHELLEVVINQF